MSRTFSIGGVHPHDNKLSADAQIKYFPVGEKVYIPMNQHIGAPAEPVVAVGDTVKVGQLIAKASGFISANIHSSVSGTVSAIGPHADIVGNQCKTITIEVQGDEWLEEIDRSTQVDREIKLSKEEIIKRIADHGIVGMGGASFPTHIKLSPPPGKKAEFLILNGAECEPFITSDYRIMLERTEEILIGATILMKALDVNKCYVGIEKNKPEAIRVMNNLVSSYPGIEIVSLKKKYPQGGEKQLIDAIIKRRVPSMALPIDEGVVVQNTASAFAVYEAVQKNKPLVETLVTFTGEKQTNINENYFVRVGTPISEVLGSIGGFPAEAAKVINGGPMMGKAISNIDASIVKSSSCILFLTEKGTIRKEESFCIRCGKCIGACPMGLEPYLLVKLAQNNDVESMIDDCKIQDCIECGCCLYSCPAHIPLLDYIRLAKADSMKELRARQSK